MLILTVVRTSNENNIASYRYDVHINRDKIAEGKIEGHDRKDGWATLVQMIAEQHLANDVPASLTHTEQDWLALQEYFNAQSNDLYFIRGRLVDEPPGM